MNKLIVIIGVYAMVWVCNDHPKHQSYDVAAMVQFDPATTDPEHYVYPMPRTDQKGGVYVGN